MYEKCVRKLGFFGFCGVLFGGVVAGTGSPALASTGCDAANANSFTRSTPANTNLLTQIGTTFDIGDTLFVTATGTPLGVGVDLLPGLQTLLVLNNANGSGSVVVANAAPHTIDITLAGGPGGSAFLTFSCTAVAPGGGGGGGGTPSAGDQADTATNATTNAVVVENAVVNGIIGSASQADPTASGPGPEMTEQDLLTMELETLKAEEETLKDDLSEFASDDATDFFSGMTASQVFGGMYSEGMREMGNRQDMMEYTLRSNLAHNQKRQAEINARLKDLPPPTAPDDFTPENPEDLGDSDSILFAPLSPFDRALARYRGFRISDTSDGPGPNVTPLSMTRTLDAKTVGWVRAVYTNYKQNDASQQDGDTILIAAGTHRDFTSNLRLGAFVTTTWGDVKSPVNNLSIDTSGYSVGAYGRYTAGALTFSATTRIGITDNDIAVSGTTGSYDTRLASVTLGVSGKEQLSDSIWMQPAISLTTTWVNREDYVNSAGTAIGGNTTWSGNISAGPTIGTSLTPPAGFTRLEAALGLLATYTYSDRDNQSGSVTASDDDYLSLSLSPQLSMELKNGMNIDLFGSYFGIGADLEGWSVGGTISIPLN